MGLRCIEQTKLRNTCIELKTGVISVSLVKSYLQFPFKGLNFRGVHIPFLWVLEQLSYGWFSQNVPGPVASASQRKKK